MNDNIYPIHYEIRFKNGEEKHFTLALSKEDFTLTSPANEQLPDWALLRYEQCQCCPLSSDNMAYCPIAANLAELVDEFKASVSTELCEVKCITEERTYSKETSLQEGLYSIFGVIMATSNCPEMDLFRPMARYHLPFSTIDESLMRMATFYFLRQFFKHRKEKHIDIDLNELGNFYEKVQAVNTGMLARFKHITEKDADRNALVILNSMAQFVSMELEENLDSLRYLFK